MTTVPEPDDTGIHALAGAYAVDAVDDVERAEFERHLAGCAECQAEVASFRATAARLSLLTEATPPARLREQVLQGISAAPAPAQPIAQTRTERRMAERSRSRSRSSRWLAAAAAVVALGGGAAVVALHPWDRTSQSQVTVADQVLQAPDAQRYPTTLPDGSTVTVVRSRSVGRAVLVTERLAAVPGDKTYQMWLQAAGGGFVSAGLVPGAGDQKVLLDGDAATALGAGVTVEPTGGSPQPTTTPIVLVAFA